MITIKKSFNELKDNITVMPVPRNAQLIHNVSRMQASTKAVLEKARSEAEECLFVNMTFVSNKRAFTIVLVNGKG